MSSPAYTQSLASFLDNLSALMAQAAETARGLEDTAPDLPPVLQTRHIARHQGVTPQTAWKRAKLGDYGPLMNKPGEPIRIARDSYLRNCRRATQAAEG